MRAEDVVIPPGWEKSYERWRCSSTLSTDSRLKRALVLRADLIGERAAVLAEWIQQDQELRPS
jgi:hypothetical protein